MKPLPQKYTMDSYWLAGPVCCDLLKHYAPHLSSMCSGCIVNNGVIYIAYQFKPDWDPEDISEEDCTEPVQARLLMVCFFVVYIQFYPD